MEDDPDARRRDRSFSPLGDRELRHPAGPDDVAEGGVPHEVERIAGHQGHRRDPPRIQHRDRRRVDDGQRVARGAVLVELAQQEEAAKLAEARAYLEYLYSKEGQEIVAKHFYRPRSEQVAAKYTAQFKPMKLVTIDEVFGGWRKAQAA